MKKLLKLSLIFILIVALAFTITGCGKQEEEVKENVEQSNVEDNGKSKTYNAFSKLFSGDNFTMSLEGEEQEQKVRMTVAAKGEENMYIDMEVAGERITIMYKDNTTYMIAHSEKAYVAVEGKEEDTFEDMTLVKEEDLKELETAEYTTGKETIEGKEYDYEEYKDAEEETTERYYFEGNELKYVKAIDVDGTESLMKILELSSEVDDSIFEIPADYEKQEL